MRLLSCLSPIKICPQAFQDSVDPPPERMKTCLLFVVLALGIDWSGTVRTEARDSELSSAMETARKLNEAFVSVASKASPSVVVINVLTHTPPSTMDAEMPSDFDELPPELRKLIEDHLNHPPPNRRNQPPPAYDSQGSGVVIREDGYILTNRHVIENAEEIQVKFANGKELAAEIRGTDVASDLAVIRVSDTHLIPAKLGDSSKVRVGEFAIAIGAPFDLDYSVTFGHISAKGRNNILSDRSMEQDFLQTDAQINPGNSGGPLINLEGEIIGINTLIRGMHTGIGFAIPMNQAKEVAEQLIRQGRYLRTWLGIGVRSLRENPTLRVAFPDQEDGLLVKQIEANGPAQKSNLKAGDLITSIDGHDVHTADEMKSLVRAKKVGDWVELEVLRGNAPSKIRLRASAMPDRDHPTFAETKKEAPIEENHLGLSVRPMSPEQSEKEGLQRNQGLVVTEVLPGSLAEHFGLRTGSILTEINRKPITSPSQFREMIRAGDLRKGVCLTYLSEGTAHFEVLVEDE